MLSYSVVFIKKINILSLRHWCFPGKFRNFLEEQKQLPEVFCKRDVLKNFAIFTEKRLCWKLFFNKVAASSCVIQHCSFIKMIIQHMCFSVNIAKFLKTLILKNICEELFLKKLSASVLALLLNEDYLLTSYELVSKKITDALTKTK